MEISKSAVLQMNTKATKRNVTNEFCIHFHYVIVHAKKTLSLECQRM